jgi:hypothetical protein
MPAVAAMAPVLAAFAAIVLPALPTVSVRLAPPDPPEFLFASGRHCLPKSSDILFQRVLIAAMIHTAAQLNFRLGAIALGICAPFGDFHLLLALNGAMALHVARFTVAACLFGLISSGFACV